MRHVRYSFKVSGAAVDRLKQLREETGNTVRNEFRRLSWQLTKDGNPHFEVSGGGAIYTMLATMSAEEYAGLVIVAARHGIPKPCIGEMVLSYYPKEAA